LARFNLDKTRETWKKPDEYTSGYWIEEYLLPDLDKLALPHSHRFAAAFLQLGGELEPLIWSTASLEKQISNSNWS